MGVAVELSRDDITVLSEDGDQPVVVSLSDGGDVSGEGQEPHGNVCYDVNLENKENM